MNRLYLMTIREVCTGAAVSAVRRPPSRLSLCTPPPCACSRTAPTAVAQRRDVCPQCSDQCADSALQCDLCIIHAPSPGMSALSELPPFESVARRQKSEGPGLCLFSLACRWRKTLATHASNTTATQARQKDTDYLAYTLVDMLALTGLAMPPLVTCGKSGMLTRRLLSCVYSLLHCLWHILNMYAYTLHAHHLTSHSRSSKVQQRNAPPQYRSLGGVHCRPNPC